MISIETARQLLDFGGGADDAGMRLSSGRAESQLAGAVAIHNILERDRVAYLADEVGMGKTYVALGAFALFRHFNPRFRMLVIAPKENIQYKWVREYRNFVRNNVRFADRRVKALHQAPARSPIICDSLLELVRETSLDPDRDFFVRLTSFSLGLLDDSASWSTKRDAVLKALPWLDPALFGEEGEPHDRKIDVVYEAARGVRSIAPVTEALRSAFPVQKQLIAGPKRPLAVSPASEQELMDRFTRLAVSDLGLPIEWAKSPRPECCWEPCDVTVSSHLRFSCVLLTGACASAASAPLAESTLVLTPRESPEKPVQSAQRSALSTMPDSTNTTSP
jgi:hypothetical protein